MSTQRMNNWNAIRAFYREALPDILESGRNEWGMDPYLWSEGGMIRFTPIEDWLWHDIRACDAVLYPQFPVLNFFVDFASSAAKVAIECDGAQWHDPVRDAERDRRLKDAEWTVYRFPGWMCRADSDPETGAPSEARKKMERICDMHGISRFSRTCADTGWSQVDLRSHVSVLIAREAAMVNAARSAM